MNKNVSIFEQDDEICAEIEKWTNGGVDMIITLMPFTIEQFIEYVDNFDIEDEINSYQHDDSYKANFTIRESRKDFKSFHNDLKKVVKKTQSKNFIINQKANKYNI